MNLTEFKLKTTIAGVVSGFQHLYYQHAESPLEPDVITKAFTEARSKLDGINLLFEPGSKIARFIYRNQQELNGLYRLCNSTQFRKKVA